MTAAGAAERVRQLASHGPDHTELRQRLDAIDNADFFSNLSAVETQDRRAP
jgi:hypothetical protein